MSNPNSELPELLTCGCCFADIQTISASLFHVGYAAFDCGGGNSNTDTKYLQLKKQGIGTVNACGNWNANKKNLTQTWTVDPFTKTTCYNGDKGTISYLCNALSNCTATQKTYNCGPVTEQEKENFCTEENFQKTLTESLTNPYTLDDVADNVDSALSQFNFNNPKATFGTVNFGTGGNKVLKWSANSGTPESKFTYFLNDQGVRDGVYKQKAKIKILKDGVLTKITESENGDIIEKKAITVTKDQIIILDPPDEPGRIYFIPYCSTKSIFTNIKTSCSGTITTKTNTNENNCTYFIGPDCKQYDTKTRTTTAGSSNTSTNNYNYLLEGCSKAIGDEGDECIIKSTVTTEESSQYTETISESLGKQNQEDQSCYKKITSTIGSATSSQNINGTTANAQFTEENSSTVSSSTNLTQIDNSCSGNAKTTTNSTSLFNSSYNNTYETVIEENSASQVITDNTQYNSDCSTIQTQEQSGSVNNFSQFSDIGGLVDSRTCKSSLTNEGWSGTVNRRIELNGEVVTEDSEPAVPASCYEFDYGPPTIWTGGKCGACDEIDGECTTTTSISIQSTGVTCSYSKSCSTETSSLQQSSTYIEEFSNTAETEDWLISSSPNESNCASWYVTYNQDIKRTATVSIEASFQAPDVGKNNQGQPNPPKNYITYVQTVRRKDNTSNPDCPNIQFTQNLLTYNNTSSGGEVKIPVPSITLNSEKDVSDCLVHVSAVTFEV